MVLDFILNKLINYCLIDGIHLVDTDSSFFIIHELPKVLYCFTYYIQKKAKDIRMGEKSTKGSWK